MPDIEKARVLIPLANVCKYYKKKEVREKNVKILNRYEKAKIEFHIFTPAETKFEILNRYGKCKLNFNILISQKSLDQIRI